ncbi:sulfurtransferase [Corynebacterium choanae]|uniref:Sulfurtransferase n=1 Tax=Corynebacterium choanae TaxID=1862358 RepID=A0A3G6J8U6_9CORY|nr:sulfurtransferase [Corynebacterium choanae]AZA12880.1 Putative thiosulfate sulfurtransferase SseA [Corynebacterium choanae]
MPIPFDPHPTFAEYAHPERLVSAAWLSARLGTPGLKVIESDADALLYDIGHIPGAMRIDWRTELNDPVTRDFIDGAAFAELMMRRGISPDDTVVVYGDRTNWWAAFTVWIFQLFGHRDVRLLDGGRDAWMAEERDTSYVVPEFPRSEYPVPERDDHTHRIFVDELRNNLGEFSLVDTRSPEEYAGDPAADLAHTDGLITMRHGHIPQAGNVPTQLVTHPNGRFRSRAELEKLYSPLLEDSKPPVVYCRYGERSSMTWFVLTHLLGREDVRNYDGAWAEWGNMVRMPIDVEQ